MPRDKPGTQRKVFMLPTELVERVAAYQAEAGMRSEVEAVRRLLDDALKYRDDWRSLTERFRTRLAESRMLAEAARETLVGHPLVATMAFNRNSITFTMTTGETITVEATGEVTGRDSSNREFLQAPPFALDDQGRVTNYELPF